MDATSKAVFHLSSNLLKEMMKTEQNKNICYSPLSIGIALNMVMLGAGGNTKSQMEKVLHASGECSKQVCEEGQQSRIKELLSQTCKKYELTMANGVFAEKTFPILEHYLQSIQKEFSGELKNVDFKNNADPERQKINEWVKTKTNGKITNLFPEGSIDNSTVVILANAIYFKGTWANKFDEKNTKEGTFHVNKNEKKTVPMMNKSGKFKFAELPEIKSKAIALPYEGGISMIIVLPDDICGLHEVLSKATPDLVTNWVKTKDITETEVDLKMPKFTLEASYQLVPMLKAMGMTEVFQKNADLSGISQTKGLFVSTVVHKAFMQVNEEGTEAAAATGVGISLTSLPIRKPFTVDHPFMFFMINKEVILFQGIVVSP